MAAMDAKGNESDGQERASGCRDTKVLYEKTEQCSKRAKENRRETLCQERKRGGKAIGTRNLPTPQPTVNGHRLESLDGTILAHVLLVGRKAIEYREERLTVEFAGTLLVPRSSMRGMLTMADGTY